MEQLLRIAEILSVPCRVVARGCGWLSHTACVPPLQVSATGYASHGRAWQGA